MLPRYGDAKGIAVDFVQPEERPGWHYIVAVEGDAEHLRWHVKPDEVRAERAGAASGGAGGAYPKAKGKGKKGRGKGV